MDGMEVLRIIKADWPDTEVILMTAFASIPQAVAAVKAGAYNYVHKPFEDYEPTLTLAKAIERKQLREQAQMLREQVEEKYGFGNIVGHSEPMQRVYKLARQAAETDATVLLSGESGTGKELFARAIHQASARHDHRFVAINCAAVPRELIESELFGHVRGAFTGASRNKQGLFMAADEGTLFLDEIVELAPDLQVKTTRAIQEKEIRRVGDTTDMPVDVRIIAATNRDLEAARKEGRLREDLYYRLNVFPIHLPPLRERAEDVPGLVRHFLRQFAGERAEKYEIDPAALALLMDCSWPGNVRELRNAIERAVVLCEDLTITPASFPFIDRDANRHASQYLDTAALPYKEAMDRLASRGRRRYLREVLITCEGSVRRAAQHAGLTRESFYRLMRKCDLDPEEIRKQFVKE